MNKIFSILPIIIIMLFTNISCEKQSSQIMEKSDVFTEISTSSGLKLKKANQDIYELLKNPENLEDEALCYNLYRLAIDYIAIENPIETNIAINHEITKSKKNAVKLETLFKKNLKSTQANKGIIDYQNLIKTTTNNMSYDDISYFPELYIPNSEIANFDLPAIIAIGTDIYSENEELEEHIPAWYTDENGDKIQILLDETTAMTIENPVLIFTNSMDYENFIASNNPEKHLKSSSGVKNTPSITEYKITKRYERSKRSEYSYEYVILYDNGGTQDGGYRHEIREIHKRDIGKLYTNQDGYIPELGAGLWIATFEYDWYASKKPVVVAGGPQSQIVECRMKFSHEWYQTFFLDIANGTNVTTNSKGTITVSF